VVSKEVDHVVVYAVELENAVAKVIWHKLNMEFVGALVLVEEYAPEHYKRIDLDVQFHCRHLSKFEEKRIIQITDTIRDMRLPWIKGCWQRNGRVCKNASVDALSQQVVSYFVVCARRIPADIGMLLIVWWKGSQYRDAVGRAVYVGCESLDAR